MRYRFASLCFIFCLIGLSSFAQTNDNLFAGVRASLNQQFSGLDKSRVPTGLLLDYAIDLVDFESYNGTALADSNYVDIEVFGYLLSSIYSAAVTQTSPLPDSPTEVMEDFAGSGNSSSLTIGIVAFRYNYIRGDALINNLINYNPGTEAVWDRFLPDSTWVNPYDNAIVLGFSPVSNSIEGQSVVFSFSDDYLYTNLSFDSIEFDAGDGLGFRDLTLPCTVPVFYYNTGDHELKLRLTTSLNEVVTSHSRLTVYPTPVSPSGLISSPAFDSYTSITSRKTVSGYTPSAMVYLKYAKNNSSGQIQKPFIVVEGFDPISVNSLPDSLHMSNRGSTNIASFLGFSESAPFPNGVGDDINTDYDIIYIDWNKSIAPIQTNADIVEQVISNVNTQKSSSADDNIIFGQSMGGLVARYALCNMERQGIDHKCVAYVSHDTPHLGANIPLGYLYFFRSLLNYFHRPEVSLLDITDFFTRIFSLFGGDISRTIQEILSLENAPSFLQMSYYNVVENGNSFVVDTTDHHLWQTEINNMGFPKGTPDIPIKNLAISNGGNNRGAYYNDYLNVSARVKGTILTDLLFLLLGIVPDITTTAIHLDFDASVSPYVSNSDLVCHIVLKYNKKHFWKTGHTHYLINNSFYAPNNAIPLDAAKGSKYFFKNIPSSTTFENNYLGGVNINISSMRDSLMFIPTVSSLCVFGSHTFASYLDNFSVNGLDKLHKTPFNSYYIKDRRSHHIFMESGMFTWLQAMLNNHIVGSFNPSDGDVFTVSFGTPPGSWTSSNEDVATISSSGEVHIEGEGSARIYYEGLFGTDLLGLPFRLHQDIEIGLPQFTLHHRNRDGSPLYPNNLGGGAETNILPGGLERPILVRTTAEMTNENFQIDESQMEKYWIVKQGAVPYSDSLVWENTGKYYYDHFCSPNTWKTVYFKYRYRSIESSIYSSIFAISTPLPLRVTPGGELILEYDDDMESERFKVKGSIEQNRYAFLLGDITLYYPGIPAPQELISELLDEEEFVSKIKEMLPWGDRKYMIIPYHCKDLESGDEFWSSVKLIYDECD